MNIKNNISILIRLRELFGFVFLSSIAWIAEAHDIRIPESIEQAEIRQLTDNTYAIHGVLGLPDAKNRAFISNTGIVITEQGVVVIDTGGSRQVGELVLEKLREITDKPVIAVFNTHIHGDHWLGNAAVREVFPNVMIYAHQRAVERLRSGEAEEWRDTIAQMTRHTRPDMDLVLPDIELRGGETLSTGGGEFKIHHTGHAHTDNDIMIEFPPEKVLFTGDIVEHRRAVSVDVPRDFSIRGQIAAIEFLLTLPVDLFVPGHGETGGREIPESSLRFLETLHASVQRYYEEGLADFEMHDRVVEDLAEFESWTGMDQVGTLLSIVYLQVEEAAFD